MVKAVIKKGAPGFTPAEMQFQLEKAEKDFRGNCNLQIDALKKRVDGVHKILDDHASRQSEFKAQSYANAEKSVDSLLRIIAGTKDHIDSLHTVVSKQTEMLILYEKERKLCSSKVESLQRSLNDLNHVVGGLSEKIDIESANTGQSLNFKTNSLQEGLDMLRKEVAAKPLEAPALRKEMDEKIALVALNNSNHIGRQTAADKRVHFLEKQLEYVMHVLKEKKL